MPPDRFRAILAQLDWGQRPLARRLGRPGNTINQWAAGTVRIPDNVAAWLERLARYHERNPPPPR